MPTSVIGIVRGLSQWYANGLEGLELHIRKTLAAGVSFVEDNAIAIQLRIGDAHYDGHLRSRQKLPVLWVSPKIFDSHGRRSTLAEAFQRAELVRNERVDIDVDGTTFTIRKF
jgi:hypothetical protein